MDKNENIIDLGVWNVPKSWDEVTLKQYQEIERYYDGKEENFDVRKVLHILTNHTEDEINMLPLEFLEKIMDSLSFLQEPIKEEKPRNWIEINGERYTVHTENQLKTGEYIASDTALKGDKHNYAGLLAILCRKDGELYDSKFEAEVLEDRIKLFEKQPITKILCIIGFFFTVIRNIHDTYPIVFQNKGSHRPHSQGYRDFCEKWGAFKTLYEIAGEEITKVGEIYQLYVSDYLQYLSYLIDKGEAERQEDEFQEQRRKAQKGRH